MEVLQSWQSEVAELRQDARRFTMVCPRRRLCPTPPLPRRRRLACGLPRAPALSLFGHAARITLGVCIGFPFGVLRQIGLGRRAEGQVGCARLPQRQQRQTQPRLGAQPGGHIGVGDLAERLGCDVALGELLAARGQPSRGTGAAPWPGTRAWGAARPSAWRLHAFVRSRRRPVARRSARHRAASAWRRRFRGTPRTARPWCRRRWWRLASRSRRWGLRSRRPRWCWS